MTNGFDVDVARVGFKVISISTLNDIKFVMPDRVREKLDPNDVSCLKVHTFDGTTACAYATPPVGSPRETQAVLFACSMVRSYMAAA